MNYSGNGYGIFVGNNYDNEVYGNKIKILNNSSVKGEGEVGENNINIGKFSRNGYGLLIGHGYQYIDKIHKGNDINSSIYGNNVVVDDSHLLGIGKQIFSKENMRLRLSKDANFSGNGYGMIIGSGAIYIEKKDDISNSFVINSKIFENDVTIAKSSTLVGKGANNDFMSYFSGHSYGLLIGNGSLEIENESKFNAEMDLSIDKNIIHIDENSSLSADSTNVAFIPDYYRFPEEGQRRSLGDNFGILVGYDGWYNNKNNLKVISDITANEITITNNSAIKSTFNGLDNDELSAIKKYNSYGIAIGYKDGNISALKNNILTVANSSIKFDFKNNDYRKGYGVSADATLSIDDYTKEHMDSGNNNLGWWSWIF